MTPEEREPQRRTASVMFTDLVGSTELAAQLGPDSAEELRIKHFGILRDAVRSTGGTEVKNLGDGLMVVFAGVGAALDGAVAIQQRIERHNRTAAMALRIRIGVSTGDVSEEDHDFFGEPVVEAARLCAAAVGGQILITDTVRLLARRGKHDISPVGELELKGLPRPVAAAEVGWELPPGSVASVPLPARMAIGPATGVIGRSSEAQRLRAAQKRAFAGDGHQVVLLSGEPGVGKTTLAGEISRRAHAEGSTVLHGRCDEEVGQPYQPFVEALDGFFANVPVEVLEALDDRHLTEASRLISQIRKRLPQLGAPASTDPDAERYLLFGAVTALFAQLANISPVVLVIDDLHWADKPTVLLLRHLVATLDRAEVLLVGTYRDTDLSPTHPFADLLAASWRDPMIERLSVEGLDDEAVVALVKAFAGHELDDAGLALAHTLGRETDGNPFFTAELLRHLVETSAIRQEEGRWVADVEPSAIGLPDSIREVVAQRIRRLGEGAEHVLRLASVVGREFDLDLLTQVAGSDLEHVLDVLDAAVSSHIVEEVDGRATRFSFTHALFQHTLYQALSPSRRRRTHRRIGELLEEVCGDHPGDRISELGHHWIAAATRQETSKAARYARLAGERALASLAPDAAIGWLRRALELLDANPAHDPVERLDVLIGLGAGQLQAGDPDHRETLLSAAAEASRLGSTDRQVAAALANNRGIVSNVGTVDEERIAMLEAAVAALGPNDHPDRALLLATLAAEVTDSGDRGRVVALATEAEEIVRRLGDDATLLRVLNVTFLALWMPATIDRADAVSAEALRIAERLGDPVARFWAALNRVYAMSSRADRDGIDAAIALTDSLSEEIGQPFILSWATQVRCPQVLLLGDAAEAERLADRALEINLESGQPDAFTVYGANIAGVRLHQGQLDDFLPLIGQAAEENPGIPAFQAAYAQMLVECGRLDDACLLLDTARAADFDNEMFDYGWITMTTLWADAAATLGDVASAQVLYERLLPYADQGVTSGASSTGSVAAYLGRLASVLGRHDAALAHFGHADAVLAALRAPFWRARNQLEWARALLTRGGEDDAVTARDLLMEAEATAASHGCTAVESRAHELLSAIQT